MSNHPQDVLRFWFEEVSPSRWFESDMSFDRQIIERFRETHRAAAQSELWSWRDTAEGRLAEVIVLDQFSRNMFRGSPQAFAQDPLALALAQEAIRAGVDRALNVKQRSFLYMPYMHSESIVIHGEALKLFAQPGLEDNYKFALMHRDIIELFGRYPHRNKVLSRPSTLAELDYLAKSPAPFG